jgi:hypothetical protein
MTRPTMEEASGTGRALYVSVSIQAIAQRRRSTDLARAVQPSRRILVQLADFFRSEPSYLPIRGNLLRAISRISATVAAKSVHPRNSINSRAKLFPSTLPLIAVFARVTNPVDAFWPTRGPESPRRPEPRPFGRCLLSARNSSYTGPPARNA